MARAHPPQARAARLGPLLLALLLVLAGCSRSGEATPAGSTPSASATAVGEAPGTAVLAFGGDVHFAGAAAAHGPDLGSAFGVLAGADLGMVNLETAITTRGTPGPKQYVFRAPPEDLVLLRKAGVDLVTVANNHGMDYGRTGLLDTLAAAKSAQLPLIGAGHDAAAAYAPYTTTVHGLKIAVFAATDVLDAFATTTWPAGATTPGLASSKDSARLVAAVREESASADVVVVYLHWGVERQVCPTARQRQLAAQLAAAGAQVVVGSHAHVQQPTAEVGGAFVAYGLGNFHFYAHDGPGARSGVLTVTVGRKGVQSSRWHPATIVGGRPRLDTGAAATRRAGELTTLCPGGSGAGATSGTASATRAARPSSAAAATGDRASSSASSASPASSASAASSSAPAPSGGAGAASSTATRSGAAPTPPAPSTLPTP
jgi:poly-gamma-glutamate synthesis protein (capsule biosynthesis protein)